jgi:ribosomal protein L24E
MDDTDVSTETCDYCESEIDASEWHPVRAVHQDGELEILAFCTSECVESWNDVADRSPSEDDYVV